MNSTNKEEMYSALNLELTEVRISLAEVYTEIRASNDKVNFGGPVLQKRRLELEVKLEGLTRKSVELDEFYGE